MSEFDKEREREKLREKYGEEYESREATQQMSELLLQGATMTNQHCDDCGDPIFRYDGQEFCPTCQAETGGESKSKSESGDAGTRDARDRRDDETGDETEPATAGATPARRERASQSNRTEESRANTVEVDTPGSNAADDTVTGQRERASGQDGGGPTRGPTSSPDRARETETAGEGSSNIRTARTALERTLVRFARAAEATDDPGTARDHLVAAREAAEALSALRR